MRAGDLNILNGMKGEGKMGERGGSILSNLAVLPFVYDFSAN